MSGANPGQSQKKVALTGSRNGIADESKHGRVQKQKAHRQTGGSGFGGGPIKHGLPQNVQIFVDGTLVFRNRFGTETRFWNQTIDGIVVVVVVVVVIAA